jgi:hypothetical protein
LNLRKLKRGNNRSRLAVSEIMGAILMLGATILIGLVAWIYVGQSAQRGETGLNNQAIENFRVASANFSTTNLKLVTLDIYNVQQGSAYITQIIVTNGTWTSSNPVLTWTNSSSATAYNGPNCHSCTPLKGQTITLITVNVGTNFIKTSNLVNCTYTFKVISEYGQDVQYQQVR